MPEPEKLAWSGVCEKCLTVVTVYPHPDASAETIKEIAQGPQAWEAFTECYVCEGHIDWNGSDPVKEVIR